jgi:hypothetical protein
MTQFGDTMERFQICLYAGSEIGAKVNVQNGQRVSTQLGHLLGKQNNQYLNHMEPMERPRTTAVKTP